MTAGSGPMFVGPDVAAWQSMALTVQPSQPSQPNDPGGRGADFGKSSPVGLLVLILFFIAVAFLVRSMTKHLKRVPASFDNEEPATEPDATDSDAADSPAEPEPSDSDAVEKK